MSACIQGRAQGCLTADLTSYCCVAAEKWHHLSGDDARGKALGALCEFVHHPSHLAGAGVHVWCRDVHVVSQHGAQGLQGQKGGDEGAGQLGGRRAGTRGQAAQCLSWSQRGFWSLCQQACLAAQQDRSASATHQQRQPPLAECGSHPSTHPPTCTSLRVRSSSSRSDRSLGSTQMPPLAPPKGMSITAGSQQGRQSSKPKAAVGKAGLAGAGKNSTGRLAPASPTASQHTSASDSPTCGLPGHQGGQAAAAGEIVHVQQGRSAGWQVGGASRATAARQGLLGGQQAQLFWPPPPSLASTLPAAAR